MMVQTSQVGQPTNPTITGLTAWWDAQPPPQCKASNTSGFKRIL